MATKTILDVEGYSITQTDEVGMAIPYAAHDRTEGARNYGFRDLSGCPELVSDIAEAKDSAGMQAILKVLNAPGSLLMSLGCERTVTRSSNPKMLPFLVVSYVGMAFRDSLRNSSPDTFIEMAKALGPGLAGPGERRYRCNFTVEPLDRFFGDQGRFALIVKPFAAGKTQAAAEAAWEYAAEKLARAIEQLPAVKGHDSQ